MTAFDLKLFRVFDEIHRSRSVSRAAHSLGVTQPSVSIALARLRRHFGDPLFVRTSEGMQPTPFAAELALRVREGMALLEGAQGHKASFDPARSEQRFRLCLTDISQAVLLPALLSA